MDTIKFAGIDIGSNAIRLIINNVVPGENYGDSILNKIVYLRLPMRLGGDVFQYGQITDSKIKEFLTGLKIYKDIMEYYHIEEDHYRACATSATRSASNGIDVIKLVQKELGLKIDVINGIEESELLFKTNIYNLPEGNIFLSADLGGGSLQITLFKNDTLFWTHSYEIGTVRILSKKTKQSEFDDFENKMKEIASKYDDLRLIGSGGNINKISKVLSNKYLKIQDIRTLYDELEPMTINQRIKKYSFREDRADVIVPAAGIYIKLMELLNIDTIYVPKIGLADGIIRELYEKHVEQI